MTAKVVLHQDDVGMCHGANAAFVELSLLGTITSGSVMVPCPWFAEMADLDAAHPELDLGVHITLTAEKRYYAWGPLTRPAASAGLSNDLGSFWPDVATVRRHAHPDAVEAEMRAQVDRALAAGIDVTHLDAHMGAALAPEFVDAYVRIGVEYRLPVLLTRRLDDYGPNNHLVGATQADLDGALGTAAEAGMVLFDRVLESEWGTHDLPEPRLTSLIGGLADGLTFVCLHPNAPGELEWIEPDSAHIRTNEYDLFRTPGWRHFVDGLAAEPVGMRWIRDEMRASGQG